MRNPLDPPIQAVRERAGFAATGIDRARRYLLEANLRTLVAGLRVNPNDPVNQGVLADVVEVLARELNDV